MTSRLFICALCVLVFSCFAGSLPSDRRIGEACAVYATNSLAAEGDQKDALLLLNLAIRLGEKSGVAEKTRGIVQQGGKPAPVERKVNKSKLLALMKAKARHWLRTDSVRINPRERAMLYLLVLNELADAASRPGIAAAIEKLRQDGVNDKLSELLKRPGSKTDGPSPRLLMPSFAKQKDGDKKELIPVDLSSAPPSKLGYSNRWGNEELIKRPSKDDGPRGPVAVISDDILLVLKQATFMPKGGANADDGFSLQIAWYSLSKTTMGRPSWQGLTAEDDLGNTVEFRDLEKPHRLPLSTSGTINFRCLSADPKLDRFKTISGTISFEVVKKNREYRFDLPKGKDSLTIKVKNPFKVKDVSYNTKMVTFNLIHRSERRGKPFGPDSIFVEYEDGSRSDKVSMTASRSTNDEKDRTYVCKSDGKQPVAIVCSIPADSSRVDYSFTFKDVGLPMESGYATYKKFIPPGFDE